MEIPPSPISPSAQGKRRRRRRQEQRQQEQQQGQEEECHQQEPQKRRRVSFTDVEIIELPYTLGDNPCVSSGVPISASWKAQKRTCLKLDFFEQYRPKRRTKVELHLSKEARKSL